ncbi:gluconokinase [Streptomyces sp. NPDC001070]
MTGPPPPLVVVLGVSGAGKSTFGRLLARELSVPFVDGDDLHPAANIAKMTAGHPLDDADREPWLRRLATEIRAAGAGGEGLVLACSALKRAYRDELRAADARVWFVYLALDRDTAHRRVAHRAGHFMPAALVASQFAILEPLADDEPGIEVDATAEPAANAARVRAALRAQP